ncbi:hypothetical protein AYO22_07613 [Fonsecaea multimorphosa]|nr:hypothetical protein AYO22_07613 [Fonsecaea multimorphosa]
MPPSYSRRAYFDELKFPDVDTIEVLNGKSNFRQWHSDIQPVLLSNPYSSDLILGSWDEPQPPSSWTVEDQASFDEERREWHLANTATCRYIRATLAENVGPFVRQYATAKTLFFNLVWLYGEEAGIDSQGGPPVPVNAGTLNPKKGRAGLLAALEAKRTVDFLPLVCASLKPSVSTALAHETSQSDWEVPSISPSGTELPTTHGKSTKWQPAGGPDFTYAQAHDPTIGHLYDRSRISSNPSLETIQEHDEPHPGRQEIKSSRLGNSDSGYDDDDEDQDECHLEDMDVDNACGRSTSPSKKRPAAGPDLDLDLEPRPAKTSITSILKTVTANNSRARKRDRFTFSFPLRRLNPEKEKGKAKA